MNKKLLLAIPIILVVLLPVIANYSQDQDYPHKLEGTQLESTLSTLEEKYGMKAVLPIGSELYELENNELGIVSPTETANVYTVAILDKSYEVILTYSCEAESGFEAITSQEDEYIEIDKIF